MTRFIMFGSDRDPNEDDSKPAAAELWRQADALASLDSHAATCIGRMALRAALVKWCLQNEVWPHSAATGERISKRSRDIQVSLFCRSLVEAKLLPLAKQIDVMRASRIGNAASHGSAIPPEASQHVVSTVRWIHEQLADLTASGPPDSGQPVSRIRRAGLGFRGSLPSAANNRAVIPHLSLCRDAARQSVYSIHADYGREEK